MYSNDRILVIMKADILLYFYIIKADTHFPWLNRKQMFKPCPVCKKTPTSHYRSGMKENSQGYYPHNKEVYRTSVLLFLSSETLRFSLTSPRELQILGLTLSVPQFDEEVLFI